jgi:hypothetical protein
MMRETAIPSSFSEGDTLYSIRSSVKLQITASLNLMRWFIVPQIIVFALLCLTFAGVSIWGVIHSVSVGSTKPDLSDLKSLIPYMSTGSAGVRGTIIIPLYRRLHEISREYLEQEKNLHAQLLAPTMKIRVRKYSTP